MFIELADFRIDDPDDDEAYHLLAAHFSSMADGLSNSHLDVETVEAVRRLLVSELEGGGFLDGDRRRTAKILRAQVLWRAFETALDWLSDEFHSSGARFPLADAREPDADYCHEALVSLGRLEYYGEGIRRGATILDRKHLMYYDRDDIRLDGQDRGRLAEMVECLSEAASEDAFAERSHLKGKPEAIAWMAPVQKPLEGFLVLQDEQGLFPHATSGLRDLLGLWSEDGSVVHPLAAFFVRVESGLTAPNVVTAGGYKRFRHRPTPSLPEAPNAGLTYNLNRRGADLHSGACEVVAVGLTLADVESITSCGNPSPFGLSHDQLLQSHATYAEEAMQGRSWPEVLAQLDVLLS